MPLESVTRSLGVLLAASQVAANIPGGLAVTGRFRHAGASRKRRLLMAGFYPLAPLAGAAAGYLILRDVSAATMGLALGLFSGVLLLATVEDLIPGADEGGAPRRISSPAFALGFVGLMLASEYLG